MDLFVRVSNKRAVDMYHKLDYVVYRRIIGYYSGERDEDAFGKIFLFSSVKYHAIWRCGCEYGGCTSLKEMIRVQGGNNRISKFRDM